jgi:hypothetical protein
VSRISIGACKGVAQVAYKLILKIYEFICYKIKGPFGSVFLKK